MGGQQRRHHVGMDTQIGREQERHVASTEALVYGQQQRRHHTRRAYMLRKRDSPRVREPGLVESQNPLYSEVQPRPNPSLSGKAAQGALSSVKHSEPWTENLWEPRKDTVARLLQPVMRLKVV